MGPMWNAYYSKELCRLCQGSGTGSTRTGRRVEGTNIFRHIHFDDIPSDCLRCISVTKVVGKFRPQKEDPKRTRIIIIGKFCVCSGSAGTKTASIDLCKPSSTVYSPKKEQN